MTPQQQTKHNLNTATKRTVVNNAWVTAILTLIASQLNIDERWGVNFSDDWLPLITVALVPVYLAFYRLSRVLADQHPTFGFILFGDRHSPRYPTEG